MSVAEWLPFVGRLGQQWAVAAVAQAQSLSLIMTDVPISPVAQWPRPIRQPYSIEILSTGPLPLTTAITAAAPIQSKVYNGASDDDDKCCQQFVWPPSRCCRDCANSHHHHHHHRRCRRRRHLFPFFLSLSLSAPSLTTTLGESAGAIVVSSTQLEMTRPVCPMK